MPENWQDAGFGLYVHWPFCQSKCPYCDFNSHVSQKIDQSAWNRAYLSEIERYGEQVPGRVLRSIYFGGGTPSLMDPDTVGAIIEAAAKHWSHANDIEITLEANPGSVEADKFADFRRAGVNRVSVGVQALNDADLRKLGRLHSTNDALRAVKIAGQVFDRFSFDLIYARQNQTLADWEAELERGLGLGAGHMSLYQLTVEDGTAFGDLFRRGKLGGLPNEDLAADMYELTQAMMGDAGMPAYEVSNHARAGQESVHNQIYWNAGDWVGIGPGAHGRISFGSNRYATDTALMPTSWLRDVDNGSGDASRHLLSVQDAATEYLMMGLRTNQGVEMRRIEPIVSSSFANKIKDLEGIGLLSIEQDRLVATSAGRPVLNAIIRDLLPD